MLMAKKQFWLALLLFVFSFLSIGGAQAGWKLCLGGSTDRWADVTITVGSGSSATQEVRVCYLREVWEQGLNGSAADSLHALIVGMVVGQTGADSEDVSEAIEKTMEEFMGERNGTVSLNGIVDVSVYFWRRGKHDSTLQNLPD